MKSLYVSDIAVRGANVDVLLSCWLRARRKSGGILFLDVVDSTGMIQCVIERSRVVIDLFELGQRIPLESSIEVSGTVVSHPNKPREIAVKSLRIIGEATLPMSPSPRSNFDIFAPEMAGHVLDNRHLYLRNPKIMSILRFRSVLMSEVRKWFEANRFMEIDAPILTPVPLYEDGSAVGVDIHGDKVFLTQCVGYYLEAAVHAFERVYNMGPSFRGEESRSPRHLMEYHHIKGEIAFANLDDIIHLVEDLISHISKVCWERMPEVASVLDTPMCLDGIQIPFPRMSYQEAVDYLKKNGSGIEFGKGLNGDDEKKLSLLFKSPFWVTGIPRVIEPFPYCVDPDDTRITRVADLIASNGMGELLGVAEKISDIATLDERLGEKGKLADERYRWVRETHQFGCVPHAAFGMGVERLIRWLLNIPHVRDAIPFPRIFRRRVYP
jgi:asparaginyl-tRNA synthetase